MRQRKKNAERRDSHHGSLLKAISRGKEEQTEQEDEEKQVVPDGDVLLKLGKGKGVKMAKSEGGNPEKANDAADAAKD